MAFVRQTMTQVSTKNSNLFGLINSSADRKADLTDTFMCTFVKLKQWPQSTWFPMNRELIESVAVLRNILPFHW